ncbi:fimbrial assembly protein [Actinotalea sp. BY-33]|uniref:Fimbrial assembly protein n=1 Tax=Actinotalea soli TaxID=2819234 RepID=A0A939LN71_9CELL|nr:fimbrial assembly protein [Actinotalea soli]MBO1750449.1 fimbrial assembly protein [Actinotalea soli]
MTTTAPPAPVRTRAAVPGASPLPQVNLLPPEVRAGRQLGRVKTWLGITVLVVILVAGLLFVSASFAATQAQNELTEVQDTNQALLAEQAQYAEVPRVLGQLSEATEARELGMSTEVLWRPYLRAVAATAPAGVSFDTFGVSAATPTSPAAAPIDPLQMPSVGTLTFTARSLTLPDTADWLEQLAQVPGFSDPWLGSAQITDESGVYYQLTGTVQITDEAYAQRFIDEENS